MITRCEAKDTLELQIFPKQKNYAQTLNGVESSEYNQIT